ncbi:hypothetical protein ACFL13_02555 [Patescibacteria group bacterium]
MEETKQYIAGGVALALLIALSIFSRKQRIKSSWRGTLEKKNKISDEGGISFRLVIKTSEGKRKRISVKKDLFNSFNEGDRVVKNSGEYDPKKA